MTKQTRTSTRPASNAAFTAMAEQAMAEDRAIVQRNGGKVTEEQYRDALDRLASGEPVRDVAATLGVSRSALHERASRDEEFSRMFRTALMMGAWARMENAENALWAGDLSTGNVQRDKAIAEHARWLAARLDRATFGDHIQVDQRSIAININRDDSEW